MAETPVETLWTAIDRLTERHRDALCRDTARTPEERLVLEALNGPTFRPHACPHCRSERLQRWGMAGGLQRYRCTACLRTCNPLTGTPLARLRRRDLWLGHAEALGDGWSLRCAARRLGVHQHTTFRWRHRWLLQPARRQARTLGGSVDIDAVPFYETGSGWPTGRRVAVPTGPGAPAGDGGCRLPSGGPASLHALLLQDRSGRLADALLPRLDAPAITAVLGPLLRTEAATLCSMDRPVFAAAARAVGAAHQPYDADTMGAAAPDQPAGRGRADRLGAWMVRFRGVSTRYLAHYLGWRRALERRPFGPAPLVWLRLAHGRAPTANVGKCSEASGATRLGVAQVSAAGPRVAASCSVPAC